MKLTSLHIQNYRSVRDANIELGDLTLFIGANASGKSAILDALRFLSEAVQMRDFRAPVYSRGGILNMAWKGQEADRIELKAILDDDDPARQFEWNVRLVRQAYDFYVDEQVRIFVSDYPPMQALTAEGGEGEWWSGERGELVILKQPRTACALAAASADASFPARGIAEYVGNWGFFDPNPFLLRRDWNLPDSGRLDHYGRNLGETLYELNSSDPDTLNRVIKATQSIVGLPSDIQVRQSEDRFYFLQDEPGLRFPVNQMGVSSGTLRTLALMTALYARPETALIGIEEPENYIHPTAISALAEHLLVARDRRQIIATTHSPLLLDFIDDPSVMSVVKRDDCAGTVVIRESAPDRVRKALKASGFSLGEYYETKGFGG